MGRFDPIPDRAYGECVTCGLVLSTSEDAEAHRKETMPSGGRSHSTRGFNPPREDRIQGFVDRVVGDAIEDALYRLQEVVDAAEMTPAEVAAALGWHSDFAEAWENDALH